MDLRDSDSEDGSDDDTPAAQTAAVMPAPHPMIEADGPHPNTEADGDEAEEAPQAMDVPDEQAVASVATIFYGSLESYAQPAANWLAADNITDVSELLEMEADEEFADAIQLTGRKRDLLLPVLAAAPLCAADEALLPSPSPANDADFAYSARGLLRAAESLGYPSAAQPANLQLPLFAVQRQSLGACLEFERRDLNEKLWPRVPSAAPGQPDVHRCVLTGATRAEKPPAATGGMLCDEQGFGKTIVTAALVLCAPFDAAVVAARRTSWPSHPPAAPSRATLVVVKPTLLDQWLLELQKAPQHGHTRLPWRRHHSPRTYWRLWVALGALEEPWRSARALGGRPWVVRPWVVKPPPDPGAVAPLPPRLPLQAQPHEQELLVVVLRKKSDTLEASALAAAHVVLTTHYCVRKDPRLKRAAWWRVVVDEGAENLRNEGSDISKALLKLRAVHRWVLTGTPIGKIGVGSLSGQLAALGVVGPAATRAYWERLQSHLAPTSAAPHRQRRARDTVLSLLQVSMIRHTHGQRFEQGGARLVELRSSGGGAALRRRREYIGIEYEGPNSSPEVVYRALEHLSRLELATGHGDAHELLREFPKQRVQKLILAASHAYTVEAGEIASHIPKLQTSRYPTADGLVPTRLCTLAEVRDGLSPEQDGIVMAATACCDPTCPSAGAPFDADGPGARVIVSGCLHSYCKRCLSSLLLQKTSDAQQVFCQHPGCSARLQLGMLRQVAAEAAVDAAELALDSTPTWRALNKRPPAASALLGSPLTDLRVMCCDALLSEAASLSDAYGRYATAANCHDGRDEVRPLRTALVNVSPPAMDRLPRLLQQAGRAGTCPICLGEVSAGDAACMPCACTAVYHEGCLRGAIRHQRNNFKCPTCRDDYADPDGAAPPLYFCSATCGSTAFDNRLVKTTDAPAGGSWCDAPDCAVPLGSSQNVYHCEWKGRAALGAYRFCSKSCAGSWFKARQQQSTAAVDWSSFEGNRRLYADGQATRDLTATPLYRQQGDTWFKLGASTAFASDKRPVEEWNEMAARFPGMPHFSFLAHLDVAAGHWTTFDAVPLGPKLARLMALIREKEEGDKVLVFSQSGRMLELVAHRLAREYGDGFCRSGKEGDDALAAFRDEAGCCVLLLESGAFAAGLTLTSANTCVVLEPQLDRAVEAQLEGRVWRPGQQRDVRIVHLYMKGTVEEELIRSREGEEAESDEEEGEGEGEGDDDDL